MSEVAPVRSDIRFERAAPGERMPWVLVDPGLGRRMRLDDRAVEVARLLDRPQGLDGLAERAGASREGIERVVAFFDRLHLLDTAHTRAFLDESHRAERHRRASPDEVPLLVRDDAAFTCTACGSCCGGQNIGPVGEDVIEALEPHKEMLRARTESDKGLFLRLRTDRGAETGTHVLCHSVDGACVFLTGEGRCLIHQELGAHMKPRVCRLFPWQFIATPEGVAVSLSTECRGFVEARRGTPLRDQLDDIREVLRLVPTLERVRPVLILDGGETLEYSSYARLEESLHEAVDAHRADPVAGLLAMRRVLCLEAGLDPDARPEATRPGELQARLDRMMDALGRGMRDIRDGLGDRDDDMEVHVDSLDTLEPALERLRGSLHRLLRPPRTAEQRALFRDKVHHTLHGKSLTTAPTVFAGFARLVFQWLAIRAVAAERARLVKRRHLTSQDLVDATVLVSFVFRISEFRDMLHRLDEPMVDLLLHRLPWLVDHAEALREPDTAPHIWKL
ncbi:MAG: YkgJ family cysteine cluster protein [Myxococcota bacterium]